MTSQPENRELFDLFSKFAEELKQLVPPYFQTIFCSFRPVEDRALKYFVMNPNLPNTYFVEPSDGLQEVGLGLQKYFEASNGQFPGMKVLLKLADDGTWSNNFALLTKHNDSPPLPDGPSRWVRIVAGDYAMLPRAPFEWSITERGLRAAHKVIVQRVIDSGDRKTLLIEMKDNRPVPLLTDDTKHACEVLLIEPAPRLPAMPGWAICTPDFVCLWPARFALHYFPRTTFMLHGAGGDSVFIQGPVYGADYNLDAMQAEGQRVIARGTFEGKEWIELSYLLSASAPFKQRHYKLAVAPGKILIVTAQTPEQLSIATWYATEQLISSLRPASMISN